MLYELPHHTLSTGRAQKDQITEPANEKICSLHSGPLDHNVHNDFPREVFQIFRKNHKKAIRIYSLIVAPEGLKMR